MTETVEQQQQSDDERRLAELGYTQALQRSWSGVLELRDLLHDHLGPRGLLHDLRAGVEQRRADRDLVGLADHLRADPAGRVLDGRARLGLPDRGRDLLLGLDARRPEVGLVHRLVQPRRPGRRRRLGRLRLRAVPERDVHAVRRQPRVRQLGRHRARADRDVPAVHGDPDAARADQHLLLAAGRAVQQHLRLLARGGRRGDRARARVRARHSTRASTSSSPRRSTTPASAAGCSGSTCCRSASC